MDEEGDCFRLCFFVVIVLGGLGLVKRNYLVLFLQFTFKSTIFYKTQNICYNDFVSNYELPQHAITRTVISVGWLWCVTRKIQSSLRATTTMARVFSHRSTIEYNTTD